MFLILKKDIKLKGYLRGYTNIVEVHNNLIEAQYKFTREQQLILLQVAKTLQSRDIYSKEMQDVTVNYSARELADNIGIVDLRHLRGVVRSLQRCIMSFKNLEENWEMDVNIFSRGQYFAGGEIEIRLDEYMIQFFKQLSDNFTKLNIKELVRLKSKYSIRIYEISRKLQFIKPPYKKEKIYSIDEFQKIVGSNYKTWQHIEEKVLIPAKKEINSNTHIYFDYEGIKSYKQGQTKGRKGVNEIKIIMSKPSKIEKIASDIDYNSYRKKKIYFNSNYWIILNIQSAKTKDYALVQLLDEDMETITETFSIQQLNLMINYTTDKQV